MSAGKGDLIVQQVDKARALLALAKDAPAAKRVADMAHAAEIYAKRQKLSEESIQYARAVEIDALTLMGEFLRKTEKNKGAKGLRGGGTRGSQKEPRVATPPTLASAGITKKESSTAQALVKLKEESPDLYEEIRESKKTLQQVKREKNDNARKQLAAHLDAQPLSAPEGPFDVIVIDPPWHYNARPEDASHRARNPYPDMSVEEICALDLPSRLAPDAIVWIWTTNAFMRSAYDVADAWKLDVKTILTWTKNRMGLGDWLRGQTEHCLLCVRGRPVVTLTNQTTALSAPLREHSRKPDEFYVLVDALCHGRKLEWFARTSRPGWAAFGAEASKFSGAAA